jgi:hypothetical protein
MSDSIERDAQVGGVEHRHELVADVLRASGAVVREGRVGAVLADADDTTARRGDVGVELEVVVQPVVEDGVGAAAGRVADSVGEVVASVVEDDVRAEVGEAVVVLGGGGSDDTGADSVGDLDGRVADAARPAVDETGLGGF